MDILSSVFCDIAIAFKASASWEKLLPVTCVVVRSVDASYHKALIVTLVLLFSVKIDSELIVKTSEKALVRHLSLEERNIHT
jgi:hypothetical protein